MTCPSEAALEELRSTRPGERRAAKKESDRGNRVRDEKSKLRSGQWECLPVLRPQAVDAFRMAQDVGRRQGFHLAPGQRLRDCGNGCRQIGQFFSLGLTSRLALHLGQCPRAWKERVEQETSARVIVLNLASILESNARPLTDCCHSPDPFGEAHRELSAIVGSCTRSRER